MTIHKILVRSFILVCLGEFHAVFFGKPFNLPVPEHRKTRHRNHQGTDTEIFVVLSELRNRRVLVWIVHKVYVAFQDLRVKFYRVLNGITIFLVFLFFEHIHESGIVNAVHTERTNEISFHHPERFGKQERVRHFARNAVNDFAPEFRRNFCLKLLIGKRRFRAGINVSAAARTRIPQAANRFFCKNHSGIKSNYREVAGNVQNILHDRFPRIRIQKVNLRRIVPRHSRAVVSVIDVARVAVSEVNPLEHN